MVESEVESELGKVQHFILLYQSNMEKYQKPTLNAYSFGFVEILSFERLQILVTEDTDLDFSS